MSKSTRKYSRPNCHADKAYPLELLKVDANNKSVLTGTKTIGLSFNSGEAAKLAVALMNAVSMMSRQNNSIDLTFRIHDKNLTVTVG